MAQFGRPDGDITVASFTGVLVDSAGNRYQNIDESSASDIDYNYGANNTAATYECSLSNVTDPVSSSGHIFRYRIAKTNAGVADGGGNAVTVTASLYQGTTLIAADSAQTATGTWTQYSLTLTGTQADSITNYTDLRLRFVTSASGGSPANRRGGAVSWGELEVPDAPTFSNIDGVVSVAFSNSGALGGLGALGGPVSVVAIATGTLVGEGALAGLVQIDFSLTGLMIGDAPISGTVQANFGATGELLGLVFVSGTSSWGFSTQGVLVGSGALAGISSAQFSPIGTLAGSGTLSGTLVIAFTENGILLGDGALGGSSSLIFALSGVLSEAGGDIEGSAQVSFSTSGTLIGIGEVTGSSQSAFSTVGILVGDGLLIGLTSPAFVTVGTLSGVGELVGAIPVLFSVTGGLDQDGAIVGNLIFSFSVSGTLSSIPAPPPPVVYPEVRVSIVLKSPVSVSVPRESSVISGSQGKSSHTPVFLAKSRIINLT